MVSKAIIRRGSEVLLCQRAKQGRSFGNLKWEFPGGTVDFGESPGQTVVREVKEEIGLLVKVDRQVPYVYSHVWRYPQQDLHVLVLGFECTVVGGKLVLASREIKEVRWVPFDKVHELDLLPAMNEFLSYLTPKN